MTVKTISMFTCDCGDKDCNETVETLNNLYANEKGWYVVLIPRNGHALHFADRIHLGRWAKFQ